MKSIIVNKTVSREEVVPVSIQTRAWVDSLENNPTSKKVNSESVTFTSDVVSELDDWAVGSACYMCHTCTNFGVQGAESRPCAKGLSDLIKRRSRARKCLKLTHKESD